MVAPHCHVDPAARPEAEEESLGRGVMLTLPWQLVDPAMPTQPWFQIIGTRAMYRAADLPPLREPHAVFSQQIEAAAGRRHDVVE